MINNKYTWSNLRINPVCQDWIDFYIQPIKEQSFKTHYSKTFTRIALDHFPLVLETSNISWGPTPFHLNSLHLNDLDFKKNIKPWWDSTCQDGYPGFVFMQRLKQLAKIIRGWENNKQVFSITQKKALTDEINFIDKLEAQNSRSLELDRQYIKRKKKSSESRPN